MRYSVIELVRPEMPPHVKDAMGHATVGHTYATATSFEEASDALKRIREENQGSEPLLLAIFDVDTSELYVYDDDS